MVKKETTVFSSGKQVECTRIDYREVSINCYGKDRRTTKLCMDDEFSRIFYPLTSYVEQLFHVEEDANFDTGLVLEALLAHAKTKMEKLIDAVEEHLDGRVYFLEILPRQTIMYDQKTTGDIVGILVKKFDNEIKDTRETEQEVVS